jgi:hypothetical protein
MRTRLTGLSALTCIAGGVMLVVPARSQTTYPTCESLMYTPCSRPNTGVVCTNVDGEAEPVFCRYTEPWGWVYTM